MREALIVWVAAFVLGDPEVALAYIDPTAGGLLVQLLLGGIAGVGVLVKLYWKKVTGWFKRGPQE